jgi:hypothetical protein
VIFRAPLRVISHTHTSDVIDPEATSTEALGREARELPFQGHGYYESFTHV